MAYTLPAGMQVQVQVSFVDANGNPATVDDVNWTTSNPRAATVTEDSSDFTLAVVAASGRQTGILQISATADVEMGAGVTPLVTLFDVNVVPGTAVAGSIDPTGDPTPVS